MILHLGVHKTGSSAIQSSLITYKSKLRVSGLHVLDCLPANHSEFFQCSFGDNPLSYHTVKAKEMTLNQVRERSQSILNKIKKEISSSSCETFVLTGEDGSLLSSDGLTRLSRFLDSIGFPLSSIRVIVYAREHADYIASAIQQNVKSNNMTIEKALAWHSQAVISLYTALYVRLATVFPASSIHFYDFKQACRHEGGLFGHFLKSINIDSSGFAEIRENIGLSMEAVHLIDLSRRRGQNLTANEINALGRLTGFSKFCFNEQVTAELRDISHNDSLFLHNVCGINYLLLNDTPFSPPSMKRYLCLLSKSNPILFSKLARLLDPLVESTTATFFSLSEQDLSSAFSWTYSSLALFLKQESVSGSCLTNHDSYREQVLSRLHHIKNITASC